ncbi:unnamed protein product [Allacma fusca]|uniref:Uncharacterized protein n=1 Tax=Allacma fusca TaxID=39272 RepID=A0A8J2K968_9HEXA|nr:unnamed protein product [Allacma fusca]
MEGSRKGKKKKKKELDAIGKYYKSLMTSSKSDTETTEDEKAKKTHKKHGQKSTSTIKSKTKKEKSNVFVGLSKLSLTSLTSDVLGKVHTASDSSIKSTEILGLEILEPSKIIWIEKSKANIGIFKVIPFEFNVFDNSGDRLLFVMPTIGSRDNILGAAIRPNTFCVHTYMGRDLCDIKYNLGNCCRKSLKAEIRIDDETFAKVVQPIKSTDFLVYDAEATAIMQIALNRNIATGFYFRQRDMDSRNTKKLVLESQHKLVIVAILIGLSVMNYQN